MWHRISSIILSTFLVVPVMAGTAAPSADDWYKNHYAPLYKDNPGDNAEKLAAMFDEAMVIHAPDGEVSTVNGAEWIVEGLHSWLAEGWLGSVLVGYWSEELNSTTAVFKAKWQDHYADGSEAYECGWYMADLKDGGWIITQYAGIDCAEHDF